MQGFLDMNLDENRAKIQKLLDFEIINPIQDLTWRAIVELI